MFSLFNILKFELQFQGDRPGGELNCSCYAEGSSEDHFIVGRSDVS